jgi:hypothetical protein
MAWDGGFVPGRLPNDSRPMAKRRAANHLESPGLEAPTDDPVPRVIPQVIVTWTIFSSDGKTALIFDSVKDAALGRWLRPRLT